MNILTLEDYLASTRIHIEPRALKEIKIYIKILKEEFRKENISVKEIRSVSMQILAWLCYGSRIETCKFRLQTKHSDEQLGYCYEEDGRIVLYLGGHERDFEEYLDTLVHEWVHHYCYQVYGGLEFEEVNEGQGLDENHDRMFYKKVDYLVRKIS